MDWMFKAALAAASVALVMTLAQRAGRGVAGMVAALPTTTAPALVWIASERGAAFAADAAVASVAACAVLAVFALVHARAARRCGVSAALMLALAAAAPMAWPAGLVAADLGASLLLAGTTGLLALAGLPGLGRRTAPGSQALARPRSTLAPSTVTTAACAALVGALAAACGSVAGSVVAGLVASLPIGGAAVAAAEHAAHGPDAAARFLRGYVAGLFGKAAFGALFAVTVQAWGAPVACLLATAGALVVSIVAGGSTGEPKPGRAGVPAAARRP